MNRTTITIPTEMLDMLIKNAEGMADYYAKDYSEEKLRTDRDTNTMEIHARDQMVLQMWVAATLKKAREEAQS